ncbi:uncharacterized protein BJ212DRAFT_1346754 [Suillus subaureus]|uniref:Uncharacterized protein n=1 Tax=Suillus subaureus TaxID=48587 RepID=A0A9P7EE13_9AGAM|nr:uncharacterized protein BJ212DRAFT_1346754 [Suillus subaureus]KAG1818664.1 hypothetical protein BJ212DRAFT_1346754 [Suillus subaureus]
MYDLDPPLDPFAMRAKYFPAGAEPSDSLSVCRPTGLTALFTPNDETNRRIRTQKARANQPSVEPNTTLATDTDTTSQSSTPAGLTWQISSAAKKAKKRNAASTANTASVANLPQVTADSQLKEMLAAMQNEIADIRTKNERILKENGNMHGEIERISKENERTSKDEDSPREWQHARDSKENERILNENESMHDEIEEIRNENERIDNDLTSVRKDLEAARDKHTSDVEALREVTALLVPLHLRVLLDLARKKVLEHLGHETWEELRASRSVFQLADTIFNDLKQKGVSYSPSYQSIFFLCSYNNIRRAGNTAAHSAKEDDVRHAVLTQSLGSHDRKCLESLFTYAYNGVQV